MVPDIDTVTAPVTNGVHSILNQVYVGNTVYNWLFALGLFIFVWAAGKCARFVLMRSGKGIAQRTNNKIDDAIVAFIDKHLMSVVLAIALYISTSGLELHEGVEKTIQAIVLLIIIGQVINLCKSLVEFIVPDHLKRRDDQGKLQLPSFLKIVVAIALWSIGGLMVLSNLGIDITSLVAGFGIGGIAIALAVQSILGDLFSSFSIYCDKPFEEGDFIIIGEHMGTVRHIGLKTTRIVALDGEEIVVPNQELTTTRVRNFKRMQHRRIDFVIGVTYDTPSEKLRAIPEMIKAAVESDERAKFVRAHLHTFNASSLDYDIIYTLDTNDYTTYMDVQQNINFALIDRFTAEGIEFAFPTQTVHIVKDE